MTRAEFRLPAEWERQSATLLTWPHGSTDWAADLAAIRAEYSALIEAILPHQQVVLLVPPTGPSEPLGARPGLHYLAVPTNDTWCRDYGPVTLVHAGRRRALDFHFNGWGGKHPAELDDRVNSHLARSELFNRLEFGQYLFELEGGAIDTDGNGHLLINRHCLRTRHPHLRDAEIDHQLRQLLHVEQVLGIDLEPTPGDDTDGHIDTLARFAATDTIVFQHQRDPERTRRLVDQIEGVAAALKREMHLVGLPAPESLGADVPASYVNFVFINDALLVPAYGSSVDDAAAGVLADAVDREVIAVPAATMIGQNGGPHCASMHIPAALQ